MNQSNPRGNAAPPSTTDLFAKPSTIFIWWGLPFLVGFATNFLPMAPMARTLVWTVALAWMGTGCTLNAMRCHRLHCYISAPVLFLGAIAAPVLALGLTPLSPHTASYVINISLLLMVMSLLAEPIWGKYTSPRHDAIR